MQAYAIEMITVPENNFYERTKKKRTQRYFGNGLLPAWEARMAG